MKHFLLCTNLDADKDYQLFFDELTRLRAVQILKNVWSFYSTDNSTGLTIHFKKYFDNEEGMFIAEVSNWTAFLTNDQPTMPHQYNAVTEGNIQMDLKS